jgi:hypothetical protein
VRPQAGSRPSPSRTAILDGHPNRGGYTTELSCAGMVPLCGSTAATPVTGPCGWLQSRLLPSGSRPRASRLTARRWCWDLTACHGAELSRRGTAILYAFDLIEYDGEDLRNLPAGKASLTWLLRDIEAGICLNEHIVEDGPTVFAHACRLGPRASCRSESTVPIDPARAASGSRPAIPPASPCSGTERDF